MNKNKFKTKYGIIDLSPIGDNRYEMYDANTDEYFGIYEGNTFTNEEIEKTIDMYRQNLYKE